jgi:hypothetical protein
MKQLRAVQEIAKTHSSKLPGNQKNNAKEAETKKSVQPGIVQGKFAGALGGLMDFLDPDKLQVANTLYKESWEPLKNSATEISVTDGGGISHFNPSINELKLNGRMVEALVNHVRQTAPLSQDVLADFVALITHELSHAKDSVIKGRELKGEKGTTGDAQVMNVIETELRAWALEAETRERLMPEGGKNTMLWTSWINLDKSMMINYENIKAHKDTNEVISRYLRYVRRELNPESIETLNGWLTRYSDVVWSHMSRLKEQLKVRNASTP